MCFTLQCGVLIMSEFTKGDWHVSIVGNKTYIDSDTGWTIADVLDMEGEPANAHLISAAPAMYELLNNILSNYETDTHIDNQISVVLSKARGES